LLYALKLLVGSFVSRPAAKVQRYAGEPAQRLLLLGAAPSDEKYKAAWEESVKRTGELLSEQQDNPNFYRDVTFRLSASAAKQF
jgi:hypothetical protein